MTQTTYTLVAEPRTVHGSKACVALRETGLVPGIIYGALDAPVLFSVPAAAFEKLWRDAGESSVVRVEGVGTPLDVLIHEVTTDPVSGSFLHIDLLAIDTSVAVEVEVPLVFTGVAPAEKNLGGTLIKVMHELTVSALPANLPHEIEVDIRVLATFDDLIHVSDIALPNGVTAVTDADEVVALVQGAREEEETSGPADISQIAVEKKGKEEPTE